MTVLLENYCHFDLHVCWNATHSHIGFFSSSWGAVRDENEERFHRNISVIEHIYQGRWNQGLLWITARLCVGVKYVPRLTFEEHARHSYEVST